MVRRQSDNCLMVLKMSTDVKRKTPGAYRIRREAWVMRMCGENGADLVPRVLDEGEVEGRPFFVMENLNHLEWSESGAGLPDTEERRKAFFILLINSIAAVHEAGFVHCDIKPDNIMERPSDHRPILIDFGSAHPITEGLPCRLETNGGCADVTQKFHRTYTPGYDAGDRDITIQKDIFALGQVIRDSFGEDVDLAWTKIINRCISRLPDFRYPSLDDLREDINNVERRRREHYWQLRKDRIVEQREIERSLAEMQPKEIDSHRILRLREDLSDDRQKVFWFEFPKEDEFRYVIREPLPLDRNTILVISGKGILEADISGPDSSVVVLRNFATLHNVNATCPPDNDLTYVIVGPGAYLNFPNLKAGDYQRFFPGRRRILRDIDATTSFRFGGPPTFSGVEDETLDAIDESNMPASYKKVLADFFKGESFSVSPQKRLSGSA
ncbi:MAG: hypothetical protein IJH50_06825 [Kiritimatiellae bacterium]|nr:hypothetical protein [Kiritimatiellia bacterium]